MCRSRNQSQSQNKGSFPHSTNKPNSTKQNQQNRLCHDFYEVNHQNNTDSYDYEQDSVTMVFNTQFRNKNVMFDEISSQPSLQCALTDLHVSDSGSIRQDISFKNFFKVDKWCMW